MEKKSWFNKIIEEEFAGVEVLEKEKRIAVTVHSVTGRSLDFSLTKGKGIYATKYRWEYTSKWQREDILQVASALANWQPSVGIENPFAKGGKFDEMHLMLKSKTTGKKGGATVIWREIFKIRHQARHDAAMERLKGWDDTQLTMGLFRTFLWHLLFEYGTDFETATFEQVESFLIYVNQQVELGVYQKSYANQAIRIPDFFANQPIYNKSGVLRRPASNVQNPHFTAVEIKKLLEVCRVAKRTDMPPKIPFEQHISKLEERLSISVEKIGKIVIKERKKGKLGSNSDALREEWIRANRSLAIFLLIKEHGLSPKEIRTLRLEQWDSHTGELKISEDETVKVSPSLRKTLMDFLEAVERESVFLNHDKLHLLVCRSYYPSESTVNEWVDTGKVDNPGSYEYRKISNDVIERVFVLYELGEEELNRLKVSAKKVRNHFLKVNLKSGDQPMKISYYSKKYLGEDV